MKKKMIALLAGALMMISASSAFAFISSNLEVYRVVYDSTTTSTFETITDLGSLSSLTAKAGGTLLDSSTSAFTSVAGYNAANLANYKVAYFAFTTTATPAYLAKSVFISQTGEAAAPATNPTKWSSAGAPLKTVITTGYAAAAAVKDASGMTSTITGGTGNTSSFNGKGYNSDFAGYLGGTASNLYSVPLATLAANSITNLYYFAGDTGATGTIVLSLTTDVAHGTTSTATATPIPAAIYLMGSGLLGMLGLRRKQRG